jgi:hypothetical protein
MVNGREALVHTPSLDLGGEMPEGTVLAMVPATDRKGNLVGSNSKNKYDKPKCEFILKLVKGPTNPDIWLGAHPYLGEAIAKELI